MVDRLTVPLIGPVCMVTISFQLIMQLECKKVLGTMPMCLTLGRLEIKPLKSLDQSGVKPLGR